ncbi:uncharacterized protein BKA78DRAFT_296452 [Phyllosticta capitalensis]|uniref:uncharacterized protein n=1 Tax=Phyllosticta capitalensis TaxID=121624 RepID=UPI00313109ED
MAKRSRAESASPTPEANDDSSSPPAAAKYVHVDDSAASAAIMTCSLPSHPPLSFASYADYDVHYQKCHVNRCSVCRVNFPSEQFLNLHFDEYHDPIKQTSRERGEKIFACFAEGCKVMCKTPKMRREHMVAKHDYPKNYNFTVLKFGIDGLRSMLIENKPSKSSGSHYAKEQNTPKKNEKAAKPVPRRIVFDEDGMAPDDLTKTKSQDDAEPMDLGSDDPNVVAAPNKECVADQNIKSKQKPERGETEHFDKNGGSSTTSTANTSNSTSTPSKADVLMEDVTKSVAALRFIPPSIRFGRGGRGRDRGGLARS